MNKCPSTVNKIANKFNLDSDTILIKLWNNGFQYIITENDVIRKSDLMLVNRILKLQKNKKERLNKVNYWLKLTDLNREEFLLFCEINFQFKLNYLTKNLPKSLINKLKKYFNAGNKFVIETVSQNFKKIDNIKIVKKPIYYFNVDFSLIGTYQKKLSYLTEDDVLKIHNELEKGVSGNEEPIYPFGVKDLNSLRGAIFRPQTGYGGVYKYKTIETVAVALFYSLTFDHAFHNGNKRTAIISLIVFFDRYGLMLTCDENALFKFTLDLAKHELGKDNGKFINNDDYEIHEATHWIIRNSRSVFKGERPITLFKLRRILCDKYNCTFNDGLIKRKISFFNTLKTKIPQKTNGEEMTRGHMAKIRKELELDEANGIDSIAFYLDYTFTPSEFIVKYRTLLRRLSKF